MTDIRELYQNCLTAFIEQRYEDCVELGLFLKDHVYNVDLYHVILNSLDQLGKSDSKAPLAVEFKTILEQLPYEHSLLLLSEGEADISSVASEAADEVQYCRAHPVLEKDKIRREAFNVHLAPDASLFGVV
jgi:hypothetical protein